MRTTREGLDTQHLPIINAYLQRIGVAQLIDLALNAPRWVGCGMMVTALIFDILCGTRTPLSRLSQFFEVQVRALLFGKSISAAVNEDNRGGVFDRIYDDRTMELFSDIRGNVFREFGLDASPVHHATPRVNVGGAYTPPRGEQDKGCPALYKIQEAIVPREAPTFRAGKPGKKLARPQCLWSGRRAKRGR